MKKLLMLCMVLTMMVLAGCQGEPADKTEAGDDIKTEGFTFTDDLDRQVTVNNPQRVVCLLGSFAEMWQLAGGDVVATADDAWDDLGLTLAEDTVNIGNTKSVSVEKIFAADPDFIMQVPIQELIWNFLILLNLQEFQLHILKCPDLMIISVY